MIGFGVIISWGTQICNAYFCHGNLLELSLASFLMFDFLSKYFAAYLSAGGAANTAAVYLTNVMCSAWPWSLLSAICLFRRPQQMPRKSSCCPHRCVRISPGAAGPPRQRSYRADIPLSQDHRTAGHLHEAGGQGLDRLVVAVVHAKLLLFQQGSRGCIRQDAHRVGGTVMRCFHGMLDL